MRSPLFYARAALASWRLMYEIEKREGRRLGFRERQQIGMRVYLKAKRDA